MRLNNTMNSNSNSNVMPANANEVMPNANANVQSNRNVKNANDYFNQLKCYWRS